MATINIVVPQFHADKFSGGLLCVFEYAKGLRSRNHDVNIVPLLPSPVPRWMAGDIGWLPDERTSRRLGRVATAMGGLLRNLLTRRQPRPLMTGVRNMVYNAMLVRPDVLPDEAQNGLSLVYAKELLQRQLPAADVTLATEHKAALPVSLYGTGRKYYFAQHYEPYFSVDMPDPLLAEHNALHSYRLNLQLIANSSWLKHKLERETGSSVALCPNAIDHAVYSGAPKTQPLGDEIRVISYGGRYAQWKGFKEMAEGMRLARERLSGRRLRWLVYGPCILPPDNSIAPYEALGFLQPPQLAAAYRSADLLLSASWYESFPLFPLEAMACGLPVITTQYGTEEFAMPGETAAVVQSRNPESICTALVDLITRDDYRRSIAERGHQMARRFQWAAAVTRMEEILLADAGTARASVDFATQPT